MAFAVQPTTFVAGCVYRTTDVYWKQYEIKIKGAR